MLKEYHQNPDGIGFLLRFDSCFTLLYLYHYWEGDSVQPSAPKEIKSYAPACIPFASLRFTRMDKLAIISHQSYLSQTSDAIFIRSSTQILRSLSLT